MDLLKDKQYKKKMNKNELSKVTRELKDGVSYPGIDISPLTGCALSDFPLRKIVSKEAIVMHLRWQCLFLNGNIDEEELSNCLHILKDKKVIMV